MQAQHFLWSIAVVSQFSASASPHFRSLILMQAIALALQAKQKILGTAQQIRRDRGIASAQGK